MCLYSYKLKKNQIHCKNKIRSYGLFFTGSFLDSSETAFKMERVFKIRTKSNRNLRALYPSERRYSASIVIGLSMVYLQLSIYAFLMGSLIVHKYNMPHDVHTEITNNHDNITLEHEMMLSQRIARDIAPVGRHSLYYARIPTCICGGCFLMSVGFFSAFITGIFAWKQWYMDYNINFFFVANTFALLTSTISLSILLFTFVDVNFDMDDCKCDIAKEVYPVTVSLALNIFILSFIGTIWSILALKISFRGMKTKYPEGFSFTVTGKVIEVNIIKTGNKKGDIYPTDVISHFPATEKLAKYLPKKETGNLPKAESNLEYQERVNQFLAGKPNNNPV